MLILIAGITGFVGIPCARAAIARGHKVRGLARNADRLPKDLLQQLESFETLSGIYDVAAYDRAVAGVDAVINTMAGFPEMIMEAQLLLLRAAERAGVKIFHATTWNMDWRRSPGTHEIYDDLRNFAHHVEISSSIKPIYMFTGAIAEFYFCKSPNDWDAKTKTFSYHGDSTFPTRYTTADDIGNYVLEAINAPDAANGGYIGVQSFEASPEDIIKAYSAAREGRVKATLNCLGTVEDAKAKLDHGRATYEKRDWPNYIWYCYQYHIPKRSWDYEPVDVARFANVKRTSLEEFFRQNPDV
ncbi:NmrA-like family protein [Botryosphaeria dothidea]|uniref:NmrA-like family protein n=1 Tax=Botryosphaeria dothidea TaxID=55169 RepID=A0A8H4N6J2_9PEZI|nr:NmrA-like family protein [Botryosphaeria dothidea]